MVCTDYRQVSKREGESGILPQGVNSILSLLHPFSHIQQLCQVWADPEWDLPSPGLREFLLLLLRRKMIRVLLHLLYYSEVQWRSPWLQQEAEQVDEEEKVPDGDPSFHSVIPIARGSQWIWYIHLHMPSVPSEYSGICLQHRPLPVLNAPIWLLISLQGL